jgi:transposase
VTSTVHQKLASKNLLPDEHFVDAAYVDAYQLVECYQDYQVSLIGPVAVDTRKASQVPNGS